ncbi:hypothetical protein ABEB36_006821 [Hypothenemus hampei]|uniref:Rho-GAP domain-containing protein n=1 Tax=Hypothenemus hampei TaxID=57062 RepID=A0ABD1ERV4_HYPHA
MFINDVNRKEEIQNIAIEHLKKHGIKYKLKKPRTVSSSQLSKCGKKLFKVPLRNLETETVTLFNGQQLIIPKRIHEMCSFILSKVQTEGVFRKEGSKTRQLDIKESLDRGYPLGKDHQVIDVAVVLKSFLRDLPEPLIPNSHNDLFLLCTLEQKTHEVKLQCLLLACLFLPSENLNVLSYLMQFFNEVASFSESNKMNSNNLSIVVGPNIFPIDDKLAPKSSLKITKICEITQMLIDNSQYIGLIPDNIIDEISQTSSDMRNNKKKKNKRRSGSLTRILNGWRKIVTSNGKPEEENSVSKVILTPQTRSNVKKRKADGNGLFLKRKKEILTNLPNNTLLNTPFTPNRTPVNINPKGKKGDEDEENSISNATKDKKLNWYMRTRSMKSLKDEDNSVLHTSNSNRRNSLMPKTLLERQWSAMSGANNFKRKKRISNAAQKEPDYVRVPKMEYEDFKNRVSAIERRIYLELDNVQTHMSNDNKLDTSPEMNNVIENVQTAYEKTLMESALSLSTSTDQLAKRFTRDLRIRRRSVECPIIRSPSARKIGSIRRRSTERERKSTQVVRNQSWHLGVNNSASVLSRLGSCRRSKRIAELEPRVTTQNNKIDVSQQMLRSTTSSTESPCVSNFNDLSIKDCSSELWMSGESFFSNPQSNLKEEIGSLTGKFGRQSIAKLRTENVGMVRAKVRLFDGFYSDLDESVGSSNSMKNTITNTKISPHIIEENYQSIEASKVESAKRKKGNISPRRRIQKQKLQRIGRQYARNLKSPVDESPTIPIGTFSPRRNSPLISSSLQNMPRIKGSLTGKTPKRLYRTPATMDRKTPYKVLNTPL